MTTRSVYDYVPHHRTKEKLEHGTRPIKVIDQLPHDGVAARFNAWFAVKVTNGVATMWCAYAFAALAFASLPSALRSAPTARWCSSRGSRRPSCSWSSCR